MKRWLLENSKKTYKRWLKQDADELTEHNGGFISVDDPGAKALKAVMDAFAKLSNSFKETALVFKPVEEMMKLESLYVPDLNKATEFIKKLSNDITLCDRLVTGFAHTTPPRNKKAVSQMLHNIAASYLLCQLPVESNSEYAPEHKKVLSEFLSKYDDFKKILLKVFSIAWKEGHSIDSSIKMPVEIKQEVKNSILFLNGKEIGTISVSS